MDLFIEAIRLQLATVKDRQIAARGSYELQCLIHESLQSHLRKEE